MNMSDATNFTRLKFITTASMTPPTAHDSDFYMVPLTNTLMKLNASILLSKS